jgi:hypothetical protein
VRPSRTLRSRAIIESRSSANLPFLAGTNRERQAIAIAAAIFAARDLAQVKDPRDPRSASAIEEAISKARYIIDVIERKLDSN